MCEIYIVYVPPLPTARFCVGALKLYILLLKALTMGVGVAMYSLYPTLSSILHGTGWMGADLELYTACKPIYLFILNYPSSYTWLMSLVCGLSV